jgi:hypothetical protein
MLRELPIIDINNKRKKISVHPSKITFIEEITPNKCNIAVLIRGTEFVYVVPKSHKYIHNFVNLSPFGLFMEN